MRPFFLVLLLLGVGLLSLARHAVTHAEPLGLMAAHEPSLFFRDQLSLDQITTLQIEFGKYFRERAAEMPGWQCMGTGAVNGTPRAVLGFDAVGPALIPDDQTYSLAMKLTVQGLDSQTARTIDLDWSDPGTHDAAGSDDPVVALAMVGRSTIDDLLRTVAPCRLSLDLTLKGTTQITDARFNFTYSARTGTIELDRDGRARFIVPATATAEASGPCGSGYAFTVSGAQVEGRIEYRDGQLRFSELRFSHEQISGSTQCEGGLSCTYVDRGVAQGQCSWPNGSGGATEGPGQPFTSSFGLFAGTSADAAADTIVTMPLENAATLSLPQPSNVSPRLTSWQGSAVVGYGIE
jgi:hypothetical protein